jgi:hypothetical protein
MRLLTLALPLLLVCAPARASVIIKLDLPQLVGRADVIFVGKAIRAQSHWSEDRRHIVTDVTFQVERAVRGTRVRDTVVVRSLGGAVGGLGMRISGSPTFNVGDQALLFTDVQAGHRSVTGMAQGVFRLSREPSGKVLVRQVLGRGLGLARRTPSGALELIKESSPPAPQPLESFVKQVQQTIDLCSRQPARCHSR